MVLTAPDVRDDLRAFWRVLAPVVDEVEDEVRQVALQIPPFRAGAARMKPEELQARAAARKALQRRALVGGSWEPFLEYLREQGARYAEMGVAFADWFRLLEPYRRILVPRMVDQTSGDVEGLQQALRGMELFLDRTMAAVGEGYIATKARLAETAASERDVFAAMFHNASVGLTIERWTDRTDPAAFVLVAWNEAARLLVDGSPEDVGQVLDQRIPGVRETASPAQMAETLRTGTPRWWRHEMVLPKGGEVIYDVRCFPIAEDTVGLVFEDVTEDLRVEREMANSLAELERSNRALDSYAHVASHDLRSPLRDIHNLSRWIREDLGETLGATTRRHLDLLERRVARMDRLLDDLLAYSRAARRRTEAERLDLADLVQEATDVLQPPSGFDIVIQRPLPALVAPRAPVASVIRNLVDNAVHHHDQEHGRILVSARRIDGSVELEVADDGPGIPPEYQERVFDLFQTLAPRDRREGSGLGLAIVRRIVESYGGSVILASRGRGTTVRVRWPSPPPGASK